MDTKVLVVGPPRTGKSTAADFIAHALNLPLYHSDVYKELPWDEQKQVVGKLIRSLSGFVFEGCTVSRALNMFRETNPSFKPCDTVFYLTKYLVPRNDLTPGQLSMGTRIRNHMLEVVPWLQSLNVRMVIL